MSNDPFDVVVEVRNFQGNLIFLYYPKASILEFKRNRIFSQIDLEALLQAGKDALSVQQPGQPLRVKLPPSP